MDDSILMVLTGPASALALAVSLLWGLARYAGKILPGVIDRHMSQVDAIIARLEQMERDSQENREIYRKMISGIHARINPMENDVKEIKYYLKLEDNNQKTNNSDGG